MQTNCELGDLPFKLPVLIFTTKTPRHEEIRILCAFVSLWCRISQRPNHARQKR
jgi:hypothetical protein